MAKTYFLAPTRDCPPSGPIALGNIITSPLTPELPLSAPLRIDQNVMPILVTYHENWRLELEKHKKGKVGIWTSFLQMVGIGADFSVSYDISSSSIYEFKRLETQTFWPSKAYVQKSVTAPEVQEFLAKKRFRHNVYMITAISVAVGATMTSKALRERGVYVQLGMDGTIAGVPIKAGINSDVGWGENQGVSFQGGSDFVFAFRLREICYTAKRGIVEKDFTRGTLYGLDDAAAAEERDRRIEEEKKIARKDEQFELLGLADVDVKAEDVDEDAREIEDETGEQCECVALETSD